MKFIFWEKKNYIMLKTKHFYYLFVNLLCYFSVMSSGDFFVLFGQLLGTGEKFKSKLFLEPVTATGDTNGLEVPSPGRNN